MKVVVDTNVVAYLLLGTEGFVDEALACFSAVSNPIAPAHWEAELTNVLWMAGSLRNPASGRSPCPPQAREAARHRTLFVELAARTGSPLMTFDKAVIKAFPDIAVRPRDLPAGLNLHAPAVTAGRRDRTTGRNRSHSSDS